MGHQFNYEFGNWELAIRCIFWVYTTGVFESQPSDLTVIRTEVTQKQNYDKMHSKEEMFTVGQQVNIHGTKNSNDKQSKKLEPRYRGPFTVTAVLYNDCYGVEELVGTERCRTAYKGICPSEKLKLFNIVVSFSESNDAIVSYVHPFTNDCLFYRFVS